MGGDQQGECRSATPGNLYLHGLHRHLEPNQPEPGNLHVREVAGQGPWERWGWGCAMTGTPKSQGSSVGTLLSMRLVPRPEPGPLYPVVHTGCGLLSHAQVLTVWARACVALTPPNSTQSPSSRVQGCRATGHQPRRLGARPPAGRAFMASMLQLQASVLKA